MVAAASGKIVNPIVAIGWQSVTWGVGAGIGRHPGR
jgi:hypothetical protein